MKLEPGSDRRVHITDPTKWSGSAGTDFWLVFGGADFIEAGINDLDDFGWETAGFEYLAGSAADFLSSSDVGTTGGANFATANDYIMSPFIFGDYAHGQMVKELLGYDPTSLNVEIYGRFGANSDENATGFGWIEAGGGGGSPADADMLAFIGTGGTKFELIQGDGTVDAGVDNVDTASHLWKIKISGLTAEWFDNGVSQGSLTLETDLFPTAFCINTESAGGDDPVVAWVHVWYE